MRMQIVHKTIPQYDLRRQIARQTPEDTTENMAAPQTLRSQTDNTAELASIKMLLQGIASDMSGLKAGMDAVQTTVE